MPLTLASPFVAIGADTVRALFMRSGRAAAVTVGVLLLMYPAWLARANFAANDWSTRTGDATFFRAWFNQLPSRVAVLPEDYVADSMLTYMQVESGELAGLPSAARACRIGPPAGRIRRAGLCAGYKARGAGRQGGGSSLFRSTCHAKCAMSGRLPGSPYGERIGSLEPYPSSHSATQRGGT